MITVAAWPKMYTVFYTGIVALTAALVMDVHLYFYVFMWVCVTKAWWWVEPLPEQYCTTFKIMTETLGKLDWQVLACSAKQIDKYSMIPSV